MSVGCGSSASVIMETISGDEIVCFSPIGNAMS
jgi:hypothetical protein